MRSALSDTGMTKVRAVMALEIVLREVETFGLSRDPDNYAFALYGKPGPGDAPWGWRVEGHHLSLHFTLAGDRYVVDAAAVHRRESLRAVARFPEGRR